MFFIESKGIQLGQFHSFSAQEGLRHFISTRHGGVSKGAFESLNLSLRVSDQDGMKNRRLLASAIDLPFEKLIFPSQCHTDSVKIVDIENLSNGFPETDALITATPGICIGVLVADCVPILLYDTKQHVAGVAHAGWRGTLSLITSKTAKLMIEEFHSNPYDIIAGIGPSISVDNYEVGEEVIEKFQHVFGSSADLVKKVAKGKGYLDLWKANKYQMEEMGIPSNNIEIAGICTYDNTDKFFSARKLGGDSGRFATGIMLF